MTRPPSDPPVPAAVLDPATPLRLRREGLAWRTVFDDVIALDSVSQRYLAVNDTGRALWELLDRGTTVGELVTALTAAHPEATARAAADVDRFVADLRARGLVETDAPPA